MIDRQYCIIYKYTHTSVISYTNAHLCESDTLLILCYFKEQQRELDFRQLKIRLEKEKSALEKESMQLKTTLHSHIKGVKELETEVTSVCVYHRFIS